MISARKIFPYFSLFIALNIFLYLFIIYFHQKIPFNSYNYFYQARHYIADERISKHQFNLINALGQWDAQWYLKIADKGYPSPPGNLAVHSNLMEGLSYAFFPLYPLVVSLVNYLVRQVEISAFIVTIFFLLIDFFSLYFVITKLYSQKVALKTIFLMFLFPLSVFFRSYFTEGLQLFLLIWFGYFFLKEKYFLSAIFLAFLSVAKGNLLLLNLVYLFYLGKHIYKTRNYLMTLNILVLSLPLLLWILYCYQNTGDPFFFNLVQKAWLPHKSIFMPVVYNLWIMANFLILPVHSIGASKIDALIILIIALLLMRSRKILPRKLWLISLLLWLTPLLTKGPISYSRLQIISFPLFIYLSLSVPDKKFKFLITFFAFSLLFTSVFFINWYWIG